MQSVVHVRERKREREEEEEEEEGESIEHIGKARRGRRRRRRSIVMPKNKKLNDGGGGGGGGGKLGSGTRPVTEGMRINIYKMLEDFQKAGDAQMELTFPPGLNNHERAVVHDQCRRYGYKSKSHGKGEKRRVTVYKNDPRADANAEADEKKLPPLVKLDNLTTSMLAAYCAELPPTRDEMRRMAMDEMTTVEPDREKKKMRRQDRERKSKNRIMPPIQPAGNVSKAMKRTRASLPIAEYRESILDAVRRNQIIVVAGETGCGKTTQVPQYILEDEWGRNNMCKIVCTQPRRISAMTVSARVAVERGEQGKLGEGSVGYQVRLEKCGGDHTALMFCTNGVLLRRLTQSHRLRSTGGGGHKHAAQGGEGEDAMEDDGSASTGSGSDVVENYWDGITHIIMDEVHERDMFADFLMITIRDVLRKRPRMRLILMSATIDVDLFSTYFDGCPVIRVPGFTHPVQEFFLDDVLSVTGYDRAFEAQAAEIASKAKASSTRPAVAPTDSEKSTVEVNDEMEAAILETFMHGQAASAAKLVDLSSQSIADEATFGSSSSAPFLNYQHSTTGATPVHVLASKGYVDEVATLIAHGADVTLRALDGSTALDWAEHFGHVECAEALREAMATAPGAVEGGSSRSPADCSVSEDVVNAYLLSTNQDEVDILLIVCLIARICSSSETDNAILVFLPGWDEIQRLLDEITTTSELTERFKLSVLPLHSMVAADEQRKVFTRPPPGVRKVVLATNIAETAVTIDDIVYVIDSGRIKEKSYDAHTGVSTLQATWVSKANEKQRAGRAGRVRPGFCYHMYSRSRAKSLATFQLPEMMRAPLEEICLQVKCLQRSNVIASLDTLGGVAEFLSRAVEPPLPIAVEAALKMLTELGALDKNERLTDLGRHLVQLPLHPRIGKMLIYASLFECLNPMLTVACSESYRAPFNIPVDDNAKKGYGAVRRRFAEMGGGGSDQLAIAAAYDEWVKAERYAESAAYLYCRKNFLSHATMKMIHGMRQQMLGVLYGRGFVHSSSSSKATNVALVRSVMALGFYPNLAMLKQRASGTTNQALSFNTSNGQRARVAPRSVLSGTLGTTEGDPPVCIAHDELVRGESKLNAQHCSFVHPVALLLAAKSVKVSGYAKSSTIDVDGSSSGGGDESQEGDDTSVSEVEESMAESAIICIDGSIRLRVEIKNLAPLLCLRLRLADAFAFKIENATLPLPRELDDCVRVVSDIFTQEGNFAHHDEGFLNKLKIVATNHEYGNVNMAARSVRGGGGGVITARDMTSKERGKTDSKTTTPSAAPSPEKKSASAVSWRSRKTRTPDLNAISMQYAQSIKDFLMKNGGKQKVAAVSKNVLRPGELSKIDGKSTGRVRLQKFVMEFPSDFKLSSDYNFIELAAVSTPSSAICTTPSERYATCIKKLLKKKGGKLTLAVVNTHPEVATFRPPDFPDNRIKNLKNFVMERPSEFKFSSDDDSIELVVEE